MLYSGTLAAASFTDNLIIGIYLESQIIKEQSRPFLTSAILYSRSMLTSSSHLKSNGLVMMKV